MIAKAGANIPGAPGCLPNIRQRLLLRAACGSVEEAHKAWRCWRRENDPASADAVSMRLLPWIYCRREELNLSRADIAALEGGYRYAWFMNQRLINAATSVVRMLQAEGIEVLLLKGLPLLVEAYRDEGGRYMEDFDVMFRETDVERAVEMLGHAGWRPIASEDFSARTRNWRHSSELVHASGLSCDVHWRLLRRPNEPVSEEPVWAAKRSIVVRDQTAFTLSLEQMMVHLIVHGMSWQRVPPVRWILDTHLLLKRYTPDWQLVLAEAARRGVMLPVAEALTAYEEVLPGEIPRDVREETALYRPTRKQRLAHEQVARPYEDASWRIIWEVYLGDWRQAQALGRIRPGMRGLLEHLRLYLRLRSVGELPWQFGKRLVRKLGRVFGSQHSE